MLHIEIPNYRELHLEYLVLDYNGTLAEAGHLREGVVEALERLSEKLTILVVTADTFGSAAQALKNLPVKLTILPAEKQTAAKGELVSRLGAQRVVAIGNGANDAQMLATA